MKAGDTVRILTDRIPGTRRMIRQGAVGHVVQVPDEYEGSFVIVRSSDIRGDEHMPEGTGWTFRAEHLEVVELDEDEDPWALAAMTIGLKGEVPYRALDILRDAGFQLVPPS